MTTTFAPAPAAVPASPDESHAFRAADGARIAYRAWLPPQPTTKAVVLLHRGHEHSGRMVETAERLGLADDGVAVFAWDQRGHGDSDGPRGAADSVAQLAADLDAFVRHLGDAHGVAVEDTI